MVIFEGVRTPVSNGSTQLWGLGKLFFLDLRPHPFILHSAVSLTLNYKSSLINRWMKTQNSRLQAVFCSSWKVMKSRISASCVLIDRQSFHTFYAMKWVFNIGNLLPLDLWGKSGDIWRGANTSFKWLHTTLRSWQAFLGGICALIPSSYVALFP